MPSYHTAQAAGWGWKINSLRLSDAMWRQRSGSTLVQVMACCLTASSHYLKQYWLIISKVQYHSIAGSAAPATLQLRHNGRDCISNHQPHDCYSTVYSDSDQRKHQSSASLAFVWGIHRWPVNSPHKWPVTRKMFPFHDAIMHALQMRNVIWHQTIRLR